LTVGIASFKSGGSISIGANTSMSTNSGSITLLDNNLSSGNISIGIGVTMHASGTAKGVGQVSMAIGPVPVSNLIVGTIPTPNPILLTSGGGAITFSTSANASGSITTAGSNVINAAGRNVVFNEGISGGTISLAGNDTIIADPPVPAGGGLSARSQPFTEVGLLQSPVALPKTGREYTIAPTRDVTDGQSVLNALTASARYTDRLVLPERRSSKESKITSSNVRFLKEGPMLLAPDTNSSVETEFGSVQIAANSVALIIAFEGGLAVYDLHDNKKDSVVVASGSHRLALVPGRCALLTRRDVRCFEQVNPAQLVGYRHESLPG
jgi:hypothetical protein